MGASTDVAEREADVVADRVVANLGFGSPVEAVTSTRIQPSAMAQRSVIRRLSITPSALDAAMGKSKKGFLGAGKSSYATLRAVLSDYEKAKAEKNPVKANSLLERLDALCTSYLNEHKDATTTQDQDRRKLVDKLSDEVAQERATASQRFAQISYVNSLSAGTDVPVSKQRAPESTAHPFQAATANTWRMPRMRRTSSWARPTPRSSLVRTTRRRACRLVSRSLKDKGITPAEHTGILAFTEFSGDFQYMNPAASNSPGRMQANKAKNAYNTATAPVRDGGTWMTRSCERRARSTPRWRSPASRSSTSTRQ